MGIVKMWSKPLTIIVAAAALVAGCGDSQRNDQGVSFSALSFVDVLSSQDATTCADATGVTSLFGSISGTSGFNGAVPPAEFDGASRQVFTGICLRNNMPTVGIRVERVFIDYEAPGASVSIPSTTTSLPAVLGPQSGGPTAFPVDSNLPPSFDPPQGVTEIIAGFVIVPPQVMEFINFNRTGFPELPFNVIATVRASGVTTAGERIESNPLSINITFTPDVLIPPTPGAEDTGTGTVTGGLDEGFDTEVVVE